MESVRFHGDPESPAQTWLPLSSSPEPARSYLTSPLPRASSAIILRAVKASSLTRLQGGRALSGTAVIPGPGDAFQSPPPGFPTYLWFPMTLGRRCSVPTSAAKPTSTSCGSSPVRAQSPPSTGPHVTSMPVKLCINYRGPSPPLPQTGCPTTPSRFHPHTLTHWVPSGGKAAHLPTPLPSQFFLVGHIYLQREVLLPPVTSPLTAPLGSTLPPALSGTDRNAAPQPPSDLSSLPTVPGRHDLPLTSSVAKHCFSSQASLFKGQLFHEALWAHSRPPPAPHFLTWAVPAPPPLCHSLPSPKQDSRKQKLGRVAYLHLEESILGTVPDVTGGDEVHTWGVEAGDTEQPQTPAP